MAQESLIEVMREVGIALHGGGDPYHRLRVARRETKNGTAAYRMYETLIKQDRKYLEMAVGQL